MSRTRIDLAKHSKSGSSVSFVIQHLSIVAKSHLVPVGPSEGMFQESVSTVDLGLAPNAFKIWAGGLHSMGAHLRR